MRRIVTTTAFLLNFAWLATVPAPVFGQVLTGEQIAEFEDVARQLETVLADESSVEPSTLIGVLEQATGIRAAARDCVEVTTNLQGQLNAQVAALGQESETDAAGVIAVRANLRQAAAQAAQQTGECRLLALTAQRLIGAATERQQQQLTARLTTRGPALTTLVSQNLREPGVWLDFTRGFLLRDGGLLTQPVPILVGIPIVVALGALFGLLGAGACWPRWRGGKAVRR